MVNFDRLKFLRLVGEYGHAEFMLGVEGAGPARGARVTAVGYAEAALIAYVESLVSVTPHVEKGEE